LSWNLDPTGRAGVAEAMLEAYLAEMAEVTQPDPQEIEQTRLVVRVTPDDRDQLTRRIHDLLEEYRTKPAAPGAERTVVHLAVYPSR
jgi:hypothetical protein